jgi:hypothetical protein
MNSKENFKYSLECKSFNNSIPLWELEFHLWDKFSGENFFVSEDIIKLGASNAIQNEVPVENYMALVDARKDLN